MHGEGGTWTQYEEGRESTVENAQIWYNWARRRILFEGEKAKELLAEFVNFCEPSATK